VSISELRWRFPPWGMVVGVMIEEGSTGLPLSLYTPFLDLNASHMLLLNNVNDQIGINVTHYFKRKACLQSLGS